MRAFAILAFCLFRNGGATGYHGDAWDIIRMNFSTALGSFLNNEPNHNQNEFRGLSMGILRQLSAGLIAATLAFSASAQDAWQEGTHYQRLAHEVSASSGDGIEVVEIFWYGCGYCLEFEPYVQAWKEDMADDVNFIYLPAPMSRAAAEHAKAFYASEALDARDKTHDAFFQALAGERKSLNSASELADFVAEQGVDRDAFLKAYNSFGVKAQMERAMSVLRGAQVTGTPTVLVAGKYRTSPGMAGGYEEALAVVSYLVEKERETDAE